MKKYLIAVTVCVAITYAADVYFFRGQYYGAVGQIVTRIAHHIR